MPLRLRGKSKSEIRGQSRRALPRIPNREDGPDSDIDRAPGSVGRPPQIELDFGPCAVTVMLGRWCGQRGGGIMLFGRGRLDRRALLFRLGTSRGRAILSVVIAVLYLAGTAFAVAALTTAAQAQFVVTTTADCTGCGSLRDAINVANAAGTTNDAPNGVTSTITFAPSAIGTITLSSPLPLLYSNMTITGSPGVVLDGSNTYRGFFVSGLATTGNGAPPAVTVNISNLTIQNVVAQGGNGADGGGGGLGAGGGLFVNQNATVTITNVSFANAAARGGNGGAIIANAPYGTTGGGGGGGLGGAGGLAIIDHYSNRS
jgi:hypothetical protein